MSFLAPLFLLGLLAVSLPLLLHLIRRVPRGRYAFSSLLFLSPSPPRWTRRSRLDQLLLLFLRASALALLAVAFARPFLRMAADGWLPGTPGRKVAILLDTSASMRRADLWRQAVSRAEETLSELEAADDVALFAFDERLHTLVAFDEPPARDGTAKRSLARRRLASLTPGWAATDLGTALVSAAESLRVVRDRLESDNPLQIVLISDLQQGARIDALQTADWPQEVRVSVRRVAPRNPGNASLRLLPDDASSAPSSRVRVANSPDSRREHFEIRWERSGSNNSPAGEPLAVYVAPGQSRIVSLPRPTRLQADRLVLQGDEEEFDNTFFVAAPPLEPWSVLYLGHDAPDDPAGLSYYLQRAIIETIEGGISFVARRGGEPLDVSGPSPPQLVVASKSPTPDEAGWLREYLDKGGALLVVPATREDAAGLAAFTGKAELSRAAPRPGDYLMLGEIDFTHPVFAAFASPRYNDFTKIHFWSHFAFQVREDPGVRILARFDNGDPALWEQAHGRGRIFALASGWRPRESQLALSSKFVPLLANLLEQASGRKSTLPSLWVHDPLELPGERPQHAPVVVARPDGRRVELGAAPSRFTETDVPGIYELEISGKKQRFAVNVASRESDTAPMDVERLEEWGVRFGDQPSPSASAARLRQLRDVELEGRQHLWRWLAASALAVLILETWWAGRKASRGDGTGATAGDSSSPAVRAGRGAIREAIP